MSGKDKYNWECGDVDRDEVQVDNMDKWKQVGNVG